MCGIFGLATEGQFDASVLERAERLQRHRGPDAQRRLVQQVGRLTIGLAHQRLAIIDLSPAGVQPLRTVSGRSLIAYNGEVYNYRELRRELLATGAYFRTETDTEVIAVACETWGVEHALRRMNGMWAFCWIDFQRRRIVLARDRFGKKPLYLALGTHGLAFASEIKTLLRSIPLRTQPNMAAVAAFLGAYQVDFDNSTFFEGIVKLPAACYAEMDADSTNPQLTIRRYWSFTAGEPNAAPLPALVEELSDLLDDSVRLRLRSDVPVGVLLSGGLDSSAVAASAAAQLAGGERLASISAVSGDPASDESAFSRQVAAHLHLTQNEVRLEFDSDRIVELIRTVSEQNDEPIGGFSCVAQYLLMKRARDLNITVLLSGQGADEAFCGYRKYIGFHLLSLLRTGHPLQALAALSGFVVHGTLLPNIRFADSARYLPSWLRTSLPSVCGPATREIGLPAIGLDGSDVRRRQIADVEHFSVPALTHWEDRNSMAWSREVRDPFLDFRIVEFGVRLPMRMKIADGYTKYILRRCAERRLPGAIAWRKDKRGFATPEPLFLRSSLRAEVAGLAGHDSLIVRNGMVDRVAVAARVREFLARPGFRITSREIFQLLSMEMWLRSYADVLSV